jgi:histidinol dehydrogenase
MRYTRARLAEDADAIIALAEAEGLYGHAEAVRIRRAEEARSGRRDSGAGSVVAD